MFESIGLLRQGRVGRAEEGEPERLTLHPGRALADCLRLDETQYYAALETETRIHSATELGELRHTAILVVRCRQACARRRQNGWSLQRRSSA
jgi:hypothetical protein